MGKPLKICLVGCGRVSGNHLAGMLEVPEYIDVAAIVSRDPDKAKSFQRKYSIPGFYPSLEDALKDPCIEAVSLCLPNHLHKDAAVKCARAGKHVLVEKPMSNSVTECEEMIKAADDAGVTLMVGQSRRFYDAVFKSKEMVDSGKIGKLVSITGLLFGYLAGPPTDWWKESQKAGGLMIPIWGSHITDYVLWMFGKCPKRVYCEAYSNNPGWEGEDEVTLILGFEDNTFATIKMSWNTRLREEDWDGTGKMLSSSDIIYQRFIQGSEGTLHLNDETCLSMNGRVILEGNRKPGNFALQYTEFSNAIREKRTPMASGKEIINVIRVQEAALNSAATHKAVELY